MRSFSLKVFKRFKVHVHSQICIDCDMLTSFTKNVFLFQFQLLSQWPQRWLSQARNNRIRIQSFISGSETGSDPTYIKYTVQYSLCFKIKSECCWFPAYFFIKRSVSYQQNCVHFKYAMFLLDQVQWLDPGPDPGPKWLGREDPNLEYIIMDPKKLAGYSTGL